MNFVMFSPVAYRHLSQRHQAFALELTKYGHQVTYVNPLIAGGFSAKSDKLTPLLTVCTIRVPWRCTRLNWLHKFSVNLAFVMLKKRTYVDSETDIMWAGDPSFSAATERGWKLVIYDRCDLHGSFPGQKDISWKAYESEMMQKSDLILASHSHLLKTLPENRKSRSLLVKNACSPVFIKKNNSSSIIPPPVKIISSGAHFDWIDCKWLQIFSNNPQCELHIAGCGRGKDFDALIKSKNVIFHGHLPQIMLAELVHQCHIGLLPFKDMELCQAVDPIKAYEYKAGGLLIWSRPGFEHPLIDAKISNQQEAANCIKEFISAPSIFKPCISEEHETWEVRIKTVLDRIRNLESD